jgi:lia operon protein LiaG
MPVRIAVLAAAATLAAFPLVAQQPGRHTLSGDDVSLYNLAGVVSVERGTGANVVADVTLRGPDAGRLEVQARGSALSIVYPSDQIVYQPLGRHSETTLHVRADGTFSDGEVRNGRRVRITGDGRGLEAHADMRIMVPAGRKVSVYLGVGKLTATNVNGNLLLDVASADVQANGTRGTLTMDLGSGNVSVTDAEGDLLLDLGSGDVTLSGIRGRLLELDAGSGRIDGTDISADRVLLDAGSGDIRLTDVASRDLELDTGSGEVEISLTTDVDRLVLDSGSGDVTIRAPATLGARVDIETGSGSVGGDLIRELVRRGNDEDDDQVTGSIGDGRGTISVETGSGDVTFLSR